MDNELNKKVEDAIWTAESLFNRGVVSGSAANMSFLHNGVIYITKSGSVFGRLIPEDFCRIDVEGKSIDNIKPSKEAPMHLSLYKKSEDIKAVIHTHSFYATLWSCLQNISESNAIPAYTPYLGMQLGKIKLVDYYKPGTKELFEAFEKALSTTNGYILKNHGPIVGGTSIIDAFSKIEELEVSAKVAWYLREEKGNRIE